MDEEFAGPIVHFQRISGGRLSTPPPRMCGGMPSLQEACFRVVWQLMAPLYAGKDSRGRGHPLGKIITIRRISTHTSSRGLVNALDESLNLISRTMTSSLTSMKPALWQQRQARALAVFATPASALMMAMTAWQK